jgi:hypothetical protein
MIKPFKAMYFELLAALLGKPETERRILFSASGSQPYLSQIG